MSRKTQIPIEYQLGGGALVAVFFAALLSWMTTEASSSVTNPAPMAPALGQIRWEPPAIPTGDPQYLGAQQAGCAATTCHGRASGDESHWQNAAFWFDEDPHATAYAVLFSPRSRKMVQRLTGQVLNAEGLKEDGSVNVDVHFKTISLRCITCHASPLPTGIDAESEEGIRLLAHGVSCEACHGPSSQWLFSHTAANWPQATESHGFVHLERTPELARQCVSCHIGSPAGDGLPAREVTHDLIAAGHPRLDFELAAWRRTLPVHWDDKKRAAKSGDMLARWACGQHEVAIAQSALAADQFRRSTIESDLTPWPEFAHVECAACHQNLRIASEYTPAKPREPWQRVVELSWLGAKLNTKLANESLLIALLKEKAPTAISRDPWKFESSRLCKELAEAQSKMEVRSWDQMVAWYYAAEAIAREAELGESTSAAEVKKFRDSVNELRQQISVFAPVTRYASPLHAAQATAEDLAKFEAGLKAAAEIMSKSAFQDCLPKFVEVQPAASLPGTSAPVGKSP